MPLKPRGILLTCAMFAACLLVGCDLSSIQSASDSGGPEADNTEPNAEATNDAEAPAADGENSSSEGGHGDGTHKNRLADETSPYLLLHAHNPVDWYPWGEEAFAKAKKENKPIFLSIGYSSCYWCHVMERESFMDKEIAKYLNENFVCVKVDREERPDVDKIYMSALHLFRQRGGWPLSMFLTPGGHPFYAGGRHLIGGTYWPPRDNARYEGSVGFLSVAEQAQAVWSQHEDILVENGVLLAEEIRNRLRGEQTLEEITLEHAMIEVAWEELQDEFDPKWGGFGYSAANPRRPKFPEPSNLMFLIDRVKRKDVENWEKARGMLTFTLDKMAQGGIYDHLGGGFHRYSVDRFWHIPHFEKMLYDNGQLASVYAEAYKLTGNEEYRLVVEGILEFVQREMMDEGGAFYAALDAETDAEEGKFYRWTKEELDEHFSESDWELFGEIYNLTGEPNFEDDHSDGAYYVPMLSKSLTEHAAERVMMLDELIEKLKPTRERLFAARSKRERPLTDTKILTSWNGLMIRGFADAGRLLDNMEYLEIADRAATFVYDQLRDKQGRLLRTHTAGEAKLNAYLDDYAFLADGFIAIHRAGRIKRTYPWKSGLSRAGNLTDKQLELFWDDDAGGFYFTSDDHEALIARAKDPVDTVIPSGNSVSAGNLMYLAAHRDSAELGKGENILGMPPPDYREKAHQTMLSTGFYLRASPSSVPRMAVHLAEYLETAEVAPPEDPGETEVAPPDDSKESEETPAKDPGETEVTPPNDETTPPQDTEETEEAPSKDSGDKDVAPPTDETIPSDDTGEIEETPAKDSGKPEESPPIEETIPSAP